MTAFNDFTDSFLSNLWRWYQHLHRKDVKFAAIDINAQELWDLNCCLAGLL